MSALTDVFTAIANAIRAKKGVSTTYKPSEMASAISSISTGTDTSDATLSSSSQMLSGVTAYSKGSKYTGNIVTRNESGDYNWVETVQEYYSGYYPNSWRIRPRYRVVKGSYTANKSAGKSVSIGFYYLYLIYYIYVDNSKELVVFSFPRGSVGNRSSLIGRKISSSSTYVGLISTKSTNKDLVSDYHSDGFSISPVSDVFDGATLNWIAVGEYIQ